MRENDTDGRIKPDDNQGADGAQRAKQSGRIAGTGNQKSALSRQADNETPELISRTMQTNLSMAAASTDRDTNSDFGQILRDERIRRNLSVGEVARRLRLSEQQVEAIEAQDFSKLPSAAFLRGYVRNYANFLQLANVNQLLASLPLSTTTHAYPGENLSQRFKSIEPVFRRNRNRRGPLYVIMILVLGGLTYELYQNGNLEEESSYLLGSFDASTLSGSETGDSNQAAIGSPLPIPPASSLAFPFPPSVSGGNTQPGAVISPAPPTSVESIPIEAGASDSGEKALHFSFSRDSWVKVKDSDGKVILEKIHARGTEQEIKGKPPLYLVIGNASGVKLTYNGRIVDLAPYTRRNDDVARFSLE